jgi:tetratricopeptide (TPR) repeat protein
MGVGVDENNWQRLKSSYPQADRISSPPSLARINGIGTTVIGKRDGNQQLGTYVKTQVFTLLFVPLFAIRAYVVSDAQRGWYFLGRVPLSRFATLWNRGLAIGASALIVAGSISGYLQSPAYQMKRSLAQAEQLESKGAVVDAAKAYADILHTYKNAAGEARTHLEALLAGPVTNDRPALLRIAITQKKLHTAFAQQDLIAEALKQATDNEGSDPRLALHLLDVVADQPGQADALVARREALVRATVARFPDDVDAVTRLALLDEHNGDLKTAEALLTPLHDKLGDGEGARLLGQILVRKGQYEEAYGLLKPYTESRLTQLKQTEAAYRADSRRSSDNALQGLKDGRASKEFYDHYKAASEADKQTLVDNYIVTQLKADATLAADKARWIQQAKIVPVAMDLGTATLYHARALPDPAARERELNSAKQTFLAVASVAGDSDEYRLNLGQIYYWLGQPDDGKKLFDELISSRDRAPMVLLTVANLLRDVGSVSEARKLTEEAYSSGKADTQARYAAAEQRAVMSKDIDDKIVWLKRADPKAASIIADLSDASAATAMRDNRPSEALHLFLRAAEAYEQMPETAATLNNAALAYFSAYSISGDKAQQSKVNDKFAQAIALMPSDSILLFNGASVLTSAGVENVLAGRIESAKLHQQPNLQMIGMLVNARGAQEQLGKALLADDSIKDALHDFEKLTVLRPRSADSFEAPAAVYAFAGDIDAQSRLHDLAANAHFDTESATSELKEELSGAHDKKTLQDLDSAVTMFRQQLGQLKSANDRLTRAYVEYALSETLLRGHSYGMTVNLDEAASLADDSLRDSSSSLSYSAVSSSRFAKGLHSVALADPRLASWLQAYQRALGPGMLVASACGDKAFRSELLANADIRAGVDAVAAEWEHIHQPSSIDWKLLNVTGHSAASDMGKAMNQDRSYGLEVDTEHLLAPQSPVESLMSIWLAQARGDAQSGEAIRTKLHALGIEVPPEAMQI